jgi:hypothetical protein
MVRFKTPQKLDLIITKFFGCDVDKFQFTPHKLCDAFVDKLPVKDIVLDNDHWCGEWKLSQEVNEQISDVWRRDNNLYWTLAHILGRPPEELHIDRVVDESLFFS